jgi:hypothetical protein
VNSSDLPEGGIAHQSYDNTLFNQSLMQVQSAAVPKRGEAGFTEYQQMQIQANIKKALGGKDTAPSTSNRSQHKDNNDIASHLDMLPPGGPMHSYMLNSAENHNVSSSTNFNNFFSESQLNSPVDSSTTGGGAVGASGDFTNQNKVVAQQISDPNYEGPN